MSLLCHAPSYDFRLSSRQIPKTHFPLQLYATIRFVILFFSFHIFRVVCSFFRTSVHFHWLYETLILKHFHFFKQFIPVVSQINIYSSITPSNSTLYTISIISCLLAALLENITHIAPFSFKMCRRMRQPWFFVFVFHASHRYDGAWGSVVVKALRY